MDPLIQFRIPVKGLHAGAHHFHFELDAEFFGAFEASPVTEGQVDVDLELDKRPDMFVLEFDFAGTLRTECDRCLAPIDLPVAGNERLLVKLSEDTELEDADIVFVHPETQQLNVATYIYEYVLLSMPLIKVYDCQDETEPPCDQEMLARLTQEQQEAEDKAEEELNNPLRDALKDWNNNN